MGQYHIIVNLDKHEFLNPPQFDDGFKLLEFGSNSNGIMLALSILLSNSPNRGLGDLRSDSPLYGRWAGDRIVIAGDYAEPSDPGEDPTLEDNLFARQGEMINLSWNMINLLGRSGVNIRYRESPPSEED